MKERWEKRVEGKNDVIIEQKIKGFQYQRETAEIECITKNISTGGAAILTNTEFSVNDMFIITLVLSGTKERLKIPVMVKWVKPVEGEFEFEVGLEFGHDSPETMMALKTHLS